MFYSYSCWESLNSKHKIVISLCLPQQFGTGATNDIEQRVVNSSQQSLADSSHEQTVLMSDQ